VACPRPPELSIDEKLELHNVEPSNLPDPDSDNDRDLIEVPGTLATRLEKVGCMLSRTMTPE
jgi:hypothetical protein